MPPLPLLEEVDQWESEAQPLVDYIGGWMQTLSGNLGFEANFKGSVQAKEMVHQAAIVRGLRFDTALNIDPNSTDAELSWQTEALGAGIAMSQAQGQFTLKVADQTVSIENRLQAAKFEHESLREPIQHLKIESRRLPTASAETCRSKSPKFRRKTMGCLWTCMA